MDPGVFILCLIFFVRNKEKINLYIISRALLCASTKQCIEPDGSNLYCTGARTSIGTCHRRDQSVFGILNVNIEYQRSLHGKHKLNIKLKIRFGPGCKNQSFQFFWVFETRKPGRAKINHGNRARKSLNFHLY